MRGFNWAQLYCAYGSCETYAAGMFSGLIAHPPKVSAKPHAKSFKTEAAKKSPAELSQHNYQTNTAASIGERAGIYQPIFPQA